MDNQNQTPVSQEQTTTQENISPATITKSKSKLPIMIIGIIIIFLLAGSALGAYMYKKTGTKSTSKINIQTPTPITNSTKEYLNAPFSFAYPANWFVYERRDENSCLDISNVPNPYTVSLEEMQQVHIITMCAPKGTMPTTIPNGFDNSPNTSVKSYTLNGYKGIKGHIGSESGLDTEEILLQLTPTQYVSINILHENEITNKILDSFKYTTIITAYPTPTPEPTAIPQVYNNTVVGFQLNYPVNFSKPQLSSGAPDSAPVYATGAESNADIIFGIFGNGESMKYYDILVFPFTGTLDQIIKTDQATSIPPYSWVGTTTKATKEEIIVDGEKAWSITANDFDSRDLPYRAVFLKHKNYGIIIYFGKNNSSQENVLESFKFTN